MTVKHRNQHEKGRLKLAQQACPCCEEPCVIYASFRQTVLTRLYYLRCTNPLPLYESTRYRVSCNPVRPKQIKQRATIL